MTQPTVPIARSGRPRDPRIDAAVLEVTFTVLAELGYGRFTLSEVARRAGTTKPAIHRRWPTRQQLVLAALAHRLGDIRVADSGCTLCDLTDGINVFVDALQRIPPDVLGALLADCARVPELRAMFMATLFDPPRAAVALMLDQARARGDVRHDIDPTLLLDLLGSVVHYRALFGHAPTSQLDIERTVEAVLQGIASDYPRLLEHSRQLAGNPRTHHLHG